MEDNKIPFLFYLKKRDAPFNDHKFLDKSIIFYLLMVVGIPITDAATT